MANFSMLWQHQSPKLCSPTWELITLIRNQVHSIRWGSPMQGSFFLARAQVLPYYRCSIEWIFISKCTIATEKVTFQPFFPLKSLRNQIWTCHKIGQGQPRVNIYIYFKDLTHQMLHTQFQSNWLSDSGEQDFFKVFTMYGHDSHLGHMTGPTYKLSFIFCLEAA